MKTTTEKQKNKGRARSPGVAERAPFWGLDTLLIIHGLYGLKVRAYAPISKAYSGRESGRDLGV